MTKGMSAAYLEDLGRPLGHQVFTEAAVGDVRCVFISHAHETPVKKYLWTDVILSRVENDER